MGSGGRCGVAPTNATQAPSPVTTGAHSSRRPVSGPRPPGDRPRPAPRGAGRRRRGGGPCWRRTRACPRRGSAGRARPCTAPASAAAARRPRPGSSTGGASRPRRRGRRCAGPRPSGGSPRRGWSGRSRAASREPSTARAGAGRGVGRPDRPLLVTRLEHHRRRPTGPRPTHEREPGAVGRPARARVARRARRDPDDRGRLVTVDADERVRAAAGDEGQPGSVGRPLEAAVRAARREELPRRRLPSTGAAQTWPPLSKATTSPRGETAGMSPSPSAFGSPPAKGTDHTCTVGASGSRSG